MPCNQAKDLRGNSTTIDFKKVDLLTLMCINMFIDLLIVGRTYHECSNSCSYCFDTTG